jgi:hypothetical protein
MIWVLGVLLARDQRVGFTFEGAGVGGEGTGRETSSHRSGFLQCKLHDKNISMEGDAVRSINQTYIQINKYNVIVKTRYMS